MNFFTVFPKATTSAAILAALIFTTGCDKKKEEAAKEKDLPVTITQQISPETHTWYAFTTQGMESVDLPQHANSQLKRAWTEAIRISSMGTCLSPVQGLPGSMQESAEPPAYALVNRLGMLVLDGGEPKLVKEPSTFTNNTADNLVFYGDIPIFSMYRNSFFNDSSTSNASQPFLVKYDRASGMCIPLVTYQNLMVEKNAQITDFTWNGVEWLCALKTQTDERVIFDYIKWTPSGDITELSPMKNSNKIAVAEAGEREFRNTKLPTDYSLAPDRLKNLLKVIPKDFSFYIISKHTSGFSPTVYAQGEQSDNFGGTALLSDTYAIAVFQDGTTYLSGALYGKHILGREKAVAFRLPKLPKGYVYSDFAVSGTYLYVAWEEADFYQTGRSGFLAVDLDKVLYSKPEA